MNGNPPTADTSPVEVDSDPSTSPFERVEDVFARHQRELLGLLYHLVGNSDDAQDALQDAFIKCWQHREQAGVIDCLKAWVFRVVLNTGRDHRQTAWRRKRRPLEDAMRETLPDKAENPGDASVRREEVELIRRAVSELRPEEKEVFLLRENGEFTYDEIGKMLAVPVGTVKTRMRSALARLQTALRPSTAT